MRLTRRAWTLLLAGSLLTPPPSAAQEEIRETRLPEGMAAEILALRMEGDALVPPGRAVDGPLALVGGILTLNGEVRGDVVVLNGDLVLGDEGVVTGDVLIVGGDLTRATTSRVDGYLSIYTHRISLGREEGRVVLREDRRGDRPGLYIGNSRLSIRAGTGYNRIEGLPILLGPVINTGGRHPLRFDALATLRTETIL